MLRPRSRIVRACQSRPVGGSSSVGLPEVYPMLGLLEQQNLKEMAVFLDAAIEGLFRDRYTKDKDLVRLLKEARQRVDMPGTSAASYVRLFSLAYGIEGA